MLHGPVQIPHGASANPAWDSENRAEIAQPPWDGANPAWGERKSPAWASANPAWASANPAGTAQKYGRRSPGGRTAPPLEWKEMSNGWSGCRRAPDAGDRLNATRTERGSGAGKADRLIDTKIF